MNGHTNIQIEIQTDKTDSEWTRGRQADSLTADRQTYMHTDKQTNEQRDIQTSDVACYDTVVLCSICCD